MSLGVAPASSSSSSLVSDAAGYAKDGFVKEEFWSIFEEAGLAGIADSLSLCRPAQQQQQPAAAGQRGGGAAAANAPFRPVREEGEHSSSAHFLVSPLRPFSSSPPSSSSLYPSSFGYSPVAASASLTSTPASPSTLIMYDTAKRGQPFLNLPSMTSLSSSAFSPASPSRPGALFRSPLLPSGMSSLLRQSPAAGGAKSAFMPLMYSSPVVKHEAAAERLDDDDDVTQSSFPSLSSLSTQSASLPSVASAVSALSSSLAYTTSPSSSLSPFPSSLSASSSSVLPLKRPPPGAAAASAASTAAPSSPLSRSKRLKRADSNPSPPPPASSSSSSTSSAAVAAPHSAAALAASLSSSASSGGRQHKGLRHFSLKVCEKVEQQGVTTYNNVADELVRDLAADPYLAEAEEEEDESAAASAAASDSASASASSAAAAAAKKKGYDERCKNIRRRVYDALNVLMAMGIIVKEKKRITWIGLPGGVSQAVQRLSDDKRRKELRLKEKRAHLQELLVYVVALKNLKHRNAALLGRQQQQQDAAGSASASGPAAPTSAVAQLDQDQIPLRFVLIKTAASHIVHLSVSADQTTLQCDVSGPFVLHDASELLSLMGLAEIDGFELPYLVPREICAFYPQRLIKRSQPAPSTVVNESTGGRLGPGTVSLGGVKKK